MNVVSEDRYQTLHTHSQTDYFFPLCCFSFYHLLLSTQVLSVTLISYLACGLSWLWADYELVKRARVNQWRLEVGKGCIMPILLDLDLERRKCYLGCIIVSCWYGC
jgi:hypothetical protein